MKDKNTWAICGGLLVGLGIGFFLPDRLVFVGSLIGGLGIGLIGTTIISKMYLDRY